MRLKARRISTFVMEVNSWMVCDKLQLVIHLHRNCRYFAEKTEERQPQAVKESSQFALRRQAQQEPV